MAEAIAPKQWEKLVHLSDRSASNQSTFISSQLAGDEIVQNLKRLYDAYAEQKMPFIEQVRLLSVLPEWVGYDDIIQIFGASRHAIKLAHKMSKGRTYLMETVSKPCIRQRADPEMVKHFVNWLVESNTLVSGSYWDAIDSRQ